MTEAELLKKYPENGFYSVYMYVESRREWMGLMVERKDAAVLIHTVGCEQTEAEIKTWCAEAKTVWERDPITAPDNEPPDMYSRKRIN